MKRNQVYRLKKNPSRRLIYWRQAFNREQGVTVFYFVDAPKAHEFVGQARGKWIYPDESRIYCVEVAQASKPKQGVEQIVELTEALPHEIVNLIPDALPKFTKPNLP